VTDYVTELADRDARLSEITLRHLLTMSSGLRWNERGLPWSDDAETYYGSDLRQVAISDTEIVGPPGVSFVYNPYNTLLLGLVLERSTEQRVSDYMERELWEPMGTSAKGSWSLDSEDGFEKMESGLNGQAMDMALLGLVYLHKGELNGTNIIPRQWIEEATAATTKTYPSTAYQYQWWTYRTDELGNWFVAPGQQRSVHCRVPFEEPRDSPIRSRFPVTRTGRSCWVRWPWPSDARGSPGTRARRIGLTL